jgi:Ca2+-binding EF-hand superfamily protein
MMQESHTQAQHSKHRIAKEQNYEKVQQKLYDEFKLLDLDDDGNISFDEIVAFIKSKVSKTFFTKNEPDIISILLEKLCINSVWNNS